MARRKQDEALWRTVIIQLSSIQAIMFYGMLGARVPRAYNVTHGRMVHSTNSAYLSEGRHTRITKVTSNGQSMLFHCCCFVSSGLVVCTALAIMGFRGRENGNKSNIFRVGHSVLHVLTAIAPMTNTAVVGIDLGTTFSVAALKKYNGEVELIPNKFGRPATPSIVSFLPNGGWPWENGRGVVIGEIIRGRVGRCGEFGSQCYATPLSVQTCWLAKKRPRPATHSTSAAPSTTPSASSGESASKSVTPA